MSRKLAKETSRKTRWFLDWWARVGWLVGWLVGWVDRNTLEKSEKERPGGQTKKIPNMQYPNLAYHIPSSKFPKTKKKVFKIRDLIHFLHQSSAWLERQQGHPPDHGTPRWCRWTVAWNVPLQDGQRPSQPGLEHGLQGSYHHFAAPLGLCLKPLQRQIIANPVDWRSFSI